MLLKVLLLVIVNICDIIGDEKEPIGSTKELDYTLLAGEAEMHKSDILNFLNQTHVREQYKTLYNCLLSKLIGKQVIYWLHDPIRMMWVVKVPNKRNKTTNTLLNQSWLQWCLNKFKLVRRPQTDEMNVMLYPPKAISFHEWHTKQYNYSETDLCDVIDTSKHYITWWRQTNPSFVSSFTILWNLYSTTILVWLLRPDRLKRWDRHLFITFTK